MLTTLKKFAPAFMLMLAATVAFAFTTPKHQKVADESYFVFTGGAWEEGTASDPDDCANKNFYCSLIVPQEASASDVNAAFASASKPALGVNHSYTITLTLNGQPVNATVIERDAQ